VPTDWITTAEAAQRLGVKPETVYAYVSRGLLGSRRDPAGRGSLLERAQVDRLAAGGRRGAAGERRVHRFRSVASAVSHSGPDTLYYRGHDVAVWSNGRDFADGVELLLGVRPGQGPPLPALTRGEWKALGRVPLARRLRGALVRLAERGWGSAVEPAEAAAQAAGVLDALVDVLAAPGDPSRSRSRSARVVENLTARPATDPEVSAMDELLLQLLDHGLTASTTAARAAASARAEVADCLIAGHGALAGHAHALVSARVHALLQHEVDAPGSWSPPVPPRRADGFGHFLYAYGDPRCAAALEAWAAVPAAVPVLAALSRARARLPADGAGEPNVDAALAVATVSLGVPAAAGPALFGLARTVGLAAHAVEELDEELLRWRGRAATRASGPATW